MKQSNELNFKGQNIYIGLDVHLKSWTVTVLSEVSVLKTFSQESNPDKLYRYLLKIIYTNKLFFFLILKRDQ